MYRHHPSLPTGKELVSKAKTKAEYVALLADHFFLSLDSLTPQARGAVWQSVKEQDAAYKASHRLTLTGRWCDSERTRRWILYLAFLFGLAYMLTILVDATGCCKLSR